MMSGHRFALGIAGEARTRSGDHVGQTHPVPSTAHDHGDASCGDSITEFSG
jgi:hypothetical protein